MCLHDAEIVAKAALGEAVVAWHQGLAEIGPVNSPGDGGEPPSNTTNIFTGNIITMSGGKLSPVEAFAFSGDTILAVGSLEDVQAVVSPDAIVRHLGDAAVLPGFIDPHIHLFFTSLVSNDAYFAKLSPDTVSNLADAEAVLKAAVATKSPGEWVMGYGYDPSRVSDHPDLTLSHTDMWAPENPIFVMNQSGHLAYVNTLALEAAGIPPDTSDPNFQRGEDGKLNGVLIEDAMNKFLGGASNISPIEVIQSARSLLQSCVARGCTTVFDAGVGNVLSILEFTAIMVVYFQGVYPRFGGALSIKTVKNMAPWLGTIIPPPWTVGTLKLQAIKFWLDGSGQGFTAAVNEPYLGQPENFGLLIYEDDELLELFTSFIRSGWQLLLHANGDRAIDQALCVIEKAFEAVPDRDQTIMHRIEHFTMASKEHVQKAAELGLGVSHLIAHVSGWGAAFRDHVLGPERAERIVPVRDEVDHGLTYSFHSDTPISAVNPLKYVDTAATRIIDSTKEVLGEKHTIGLEEALRGVTVNPARQLGWQDEIGNLEAGKKADFVILGKDPRTVELGHLHKECEVKETWIAGAKVF